jgi:hypothetical protein
MDSNQRIIVIGLAAITLLVFCAVCLVAFFFFNPQISPLAALFAAPTATSTPTPTPLPTDTPSPTITPTVSIPLPTNTRVVQRLTPPPPTVLSSGWKRYERPADGFAITLPPEWQSIDLDPATFESAINVLKEKNPQFGNQLQGQISRLITLGTKFSAFDLSPASFQNNFATNLNIIVEPLPFAASLDFYTQATESQLKTLSAVQQPVVSRRVNTVAGPAQELQYHLKLVATGNQPVTTYTNQFLFVRGKSAYVVTLTTLENKEKDYTDIFEKIGTDFELLK